MKENYTTILAACMRLKEAALGQVSLFTSNTLLAYQPIQFFAGYAMKPLLQEVDNLIAVLPIEFAKQKQFLDLDRKRCAMDNNVDCSIGIGSLIRDLDNLDAIVHSHNQELKNKAPVNRGTCKKIFISHSSKDKVIIDAFITLLTRGAGLAQGDIFCTSIDGMKIKNGEDIRKHIQENVNYADFAILLVSKNYKESDVCLNEMGAVWAVDKKVKAYVFPDLEEANVGWLINDKAAEKLNDTTALASLYSELQQTYGLRSTFVDWTAQAKAFCDNFK